MQKMDFNIRIIGVKTLNIYVYMCMWVVCKSLDNCETTMDQCLLNKRSNYFSSYYKLLSNWIKASKKNKILYLEV